MTKFYAQYCKENFSKDGVLSEFSVNCPADFNFSYDVVDAIAAEDPEREALVWCDTEGNERRFTFDQMSKLSSRCANVLRQDGIGKGDRVLIILKRHYEYWYVILALHKLGAVAIPATHMLTEKDIVYRVNSASIKAVISTPTGEVAHFAAQAASACPTLTHKYIVREERDGFINLTQRIEAASEHFPRQQISVEDPMLLYFTSGTTGHPKAVVHDFAYPLAHIVTARHWQNVVPGGLHLTVAETGWAKAAWGKLYGQWLCGSAVLAYDFDKFSPGDLLRIIQDYKVTTFCAPPTIYRFFVKYGIDQYDLSALTYCTNAGEALSPEIYKQFHQATGIRLMEGFGQTETTLLIFNPVNSREKVGSMGKPNPLYNVQLVNDAGEPVAPGEEGEIVVMQPPQGGKQYGMLSSYGDDAALSARVWRDGVYHTGDIAYQDDEGYFWYVSRGDDIIKSSGYRIGPFEIESVLLEHPSVLECAITGEPDPERGQVIKATIVLCEGYEPSETLAKELQEFVKVSTAPYKYPRIVSFVSQLPKTISGKIRRVEIRERSKKGAH